MSSITGRAKTPNTTSTGRGIQLELQKAIYDGLLSGIMELKIEALHQRL